MPFCAYFCMGAYKQGRYKTWTLNSGLDYGVDYGLDYGLNFGLYFGLNSIMYELTFVSELPGLSTVQFFMPSSRVPKVRFLYIFFSVYGSIKA